MVVREPHRYFIAILDRLLDRDRQRIARQAALVIYAKAMIAGKIKGFRVACVAGRAKIYSTVS